jgi:hypothetical protein
MGLETRGSADAGVWAVTEWQPIETAPRDGTDVLTFPHYRVTSYNPDLNGFSHFSVYHDCDRLHSPQPTHWMPLPAPPE